MKFTIDRSRWRTGRYGPASKDVPGVGESKLFNGQHFQCCLGFYLEACGVDLRNLEDVAAPSQLDGAARARIEAWLIDLESQHNLPEDSTACKILMSINDGIFSKSDSVREQKVTAKFAEAGVEVEFIGEYPKL